MEPMEIALQEAQAAAQRREVPVGAVVLGLPAMFLLLPATRHLEVGPLPLPWLAVGVLIYPVVAIAARLSVHQSERIEREFTDLMARL